MMTGQDCNSTHEGEEADVEWTKEDSAALVAALKRDLVALLKDRSAITLEGIASRHTRRLVVRVMELRRELVALLEGGAWEGEE
jgi:hypothetical protein